MKGPLFLLAILPVFLAGCGVFERPRISEPEPLIKAPSTPAPTAFPTFSPTPRATPTRTPTAIPVKLPEECQEIINDFKLTDLLKHRQLFSIALELEFKGRLDEAIAVLQEALKFHSDNEMARMKLAQLMMDAGRLEKTGPDTLTQERATPPQVKKEKEVQVEEAPPGLDLSGDYLDVVNNVKLSSCAKGYKLFILGGRLEREEKLDEALFVYRRAISFCPEEDGPNSTINRQARVRISVLEKSGGDEP